MHFQALNRRASSTLAVILIVLVVIAVFAAIVSAALILRPFPLVSGPGGSVSGSGNVVTRELQFEDFRTVRVGNAFQVEMTHSNVYRVTVTIDDDLSDYLVVSKEGDVLSVGLKPGYDYRYQSLTLMAQIFLPDLHEVRLGGATRCTVRGFNLSHKFAVEISGASSAEIVDMSTEDFEAEISGASRLSGGATMDGDARFTVSGASTATLAGYGSNLVIDASGASNVELSQFTVHNARVELSGASRATINLDGRLDADVSGGSTLLYVGEPTMGEISVTGGSTVDKK